MMSPEVKNLLLEAVARLTREAGDIVMQVYASDFAVQGKADDSPVTEADQRAEAVILAGLAKLSPGVPVVAEEAVAAGQGPELIDSKQTFWLVDPLDGTKEFIKRNGEFTVNIALIEAGVPTLGVVLAPALGKLYAGRLGGGAWLEDGSRRRAINCRSVPQAGLTVLASRSHADETALQALLAGRKVAAVNQAGSSLKLCLLASGEADLYPRHGRTMEWDIAAGHAILLAAGGEVWQLGGGEVAGQPGQRLRYGKPGFENPYFYAEGAMA